MPKKTKVITPQEPAARRGKPRTYKSGVCRPVSFGIPAELADRLATASAQTNLSQSAIVRHGLEMVLAQSPDRLADEVRRRIGDG